VEKFGLIAFVQAFVQYFITITDYGFNLSATREISINRDNQQQLSRIFSAVILTKTALLAASFIVLSILVFSIGKFRKDWLLYIFSFGLVIGQVILPMWFFQGMEKMKLVAILDVVTKLLFTISIFIFVKQSSGYIYVPLLNSLSFITSGIIGLWIAMHWFKITIRIPTFSDIIHQLKEGWHVFISTIAISFYTTSNTFILGLFTNNTIVGYYSGGERIIGAVRGVLSPLSQTMYPHISKLASKSKQDALVFAKKMVKLASLPLLLMSFVLLIFAPQISNILLGQKFKNSIVVIRILSFVPFITGLSNIFSIQLMLNWGLKKAFMKIFTLAAIVSVFMSLILVVLLRHIGISISVLATEIIIMALTFISLKRSGIDIFRAKMNCKDGL
jgi:PST family polysaccharide transporter